MNWKLLLQSLNDLEPHSGDPNFVISNLLYRAELRDLRSMEVIKILPPTQKNKKYAALIRLNGKQKLINFGDIRYQHYRDTTPLKLYSHLDHNDWNRKQNYLARHIHNNGPAGILAREFLW